MNSWLVSRGQGARAGGSSSGCSGDVNRHAACHEQVQGRIARLVDHMTPGDRKRRGDLRSGWARLEGAVGRTFVGGVQTEQLDAMGAEPGSAGRIVEVMDGPLSMISPGRGYACTARAWLVSRWYLSNGTVGRRTRRPVSAGERPRVPCLNVSLPPVISLECDVARRGHSNWPSCPVARLLEAFMIIIHYTRRIYRDDSRRFRARVAALLHHKQIKISERRSRTSTGL
jgi:hypothetical protein